MEVQFASGEKKKKKKTPRGKYSGICGRINQVNDELRFKKAEQDDEKKWSVF